MRQLSVKWTVVLLSSTSVLIWRLVDFANEAASQDFHMTRIGLALRGPDAEVLQLLIILGSIAVMWNALTKLVRSHLIDPSRQSR